MVSIRLSAWDKNTAAGFGLFNSKNHGDGMAAVLPVIAFKRP
jgi:hypothetical protein